MSYISTNPLNRIAKSVGDIATVLGGDPVVIGTYPLPMKKIADAVDGIAAKITQDGGVSAKVPTIILGTGDYDSDTGEPTISDPESNVFYLVPNGDSTSDDLFDEWVYVNNGWERFGSGGGTGGAAKLITISLTSTWIGNASPYTQSVSITGGTANSKVDLQPSATVLNQMATDGVSALYIVNDNGSFTAYAIDNKPSVAMTVQATVSTVSV